MYRVNKTWVSDVKLWYLCVVFWILVVLRKYYFLYLNWIFSCLYFQFILLPIWFNGLRLHPITKFQNIRVVPRGLVYTIFTTLTVTFGECTRWICKNIFIFSIFLLPQLVNQTFENCLPCIFQLSLLKSWNYYRP